VPVHGRPAPPTLEAVAAAFPQLEIIELIGQGGMGVVYKARQPKLERFVALKLLRHGPDAAPAFAERFNREARVLARLSHPSIVTVFDFGQAGEFFFLMMEYVDGVNLRQAMLAGRFTPAQALALVPKICEALQYAHDEGILHRDIKPENILLDTRGRVKIADFGIAKLVGDDAREAKLTESGSAVGTPHYMAPEQLETPQDVDQRADIYSLGVVFYEMLTGELPIGRFAPPSEKSTVDPRVDQVVFQALEKEREKRFSSAREVKTRVETISNDAGAAAPTGGEQSGVRLKPSLKPIVLLGLIVAMVGLIINTVGPAGTMVSAVATFATSGVGGALGAALAVAAFGWLIWLTNQCRNRLLAPLGLGPVSAAALRAGGEHSVMDRRLRKVATITLLTLAVFLGAHLVGFVVSVLGGLFRAGWIGYVLVAGVAASAYLTRGKWKPRVSQLLREVLPAEEPNSGAMPPVPGELAVPPVIGSTHSSRAWVVLMVGLALLISLSMLGAIFGFFHLRSGRTAREKKVHARANVPEAVLRAMPVPETSRLPGLTVFRWKCTVPANHVLLFQLVQWSSNGVPTVLDKLSSYAVAGSNKPVEATFQWSVQDGARLSPDLQGQYRWDRSVSFGTSRLDGPPLWMPKETPEWGSLLAGDGQKNKVYPGGTLPMQMFVRTGQDVDSRAVEAQVTLEPVPAGVSLGKTPRVDLGTNWLEVSSQPLNPAAENPEPPREQP
jgi:tRNA A-37 threonylcarbamoyl transferase component Bud32